MMGLRMLRSLLRCLHVQATSPLRPAGQRRQNHLSALAPARVPAGLATLGSPAHLCVERGDADRAGLVRACPDKSLRSLVGASWLPTVVVAGLLAPTASIGQAATPPLGPRTIERATPIPETPRPDCHLHASRYHGVNSEVLRAILWNESRMNPNAINRRNRNGSVDVGISQYNSTHFPSLAKVGVTPAMLLDPCVGIYVAAWHLSKSIRAHGNTWFGIGAYHSATSYFNHAYANGIAATLAQWGHIPPNFVPFPNAPRSTAEALRRRSTTETASPSVRSPSPPIVALSD